MIYTFTCAVCGKGVTTKDPRKMYCGMTCRDRAAYERRKAAGPRKRKPKKPRTDPGGYDRKRAEESHVRQAGINQQARDAGLTYGRYQYLRYLEQLEEQK